MNFLRKHGAWVLIALLMGGAFIATQMAKGG